jgi:hypothetical protein
LNDREGLKLHESTKDPEAVNGREAVCCEPHNSAVCSANSEKPRRTDCAAPHDMFDMIVSQRLADTTLFDMVTFLDSLMAPDTDSDKETKFTSEQEKPTDVSWEFEGGRPETSDTGDRIIRVTD